MCILRAILLELSYHVTVIPVRYCSPASACSPWISPVGFSCCMQYFKGTLDGHLDVLISIKRKRAFPTVPSCRHFLYLSADSCRRPLLVLAYCSHCSTNITCQLGPLLSHLTTTHSSLWIFFFFHSG